eukprot:m.263839 g.263839  ORF g.263839 m.263839 type:complete len:259 (-) comp52601_c0_seq1:157-933(-)
MEGVSVGNLSEQHVTGIVKSRAIKRPQISTVVFDVGGVLASDGMPSSGIDNVFTQVFGLDGYNSTMIKEQATLLWQKVKVGEIDSQGFYSQLLQHCGLDTTKISEVHDAHINYMAQWSSSRLPAILNLLTRIKESGYRLGVISNHVTLWLDDIFTKCGYFDIFEADLVVVSDAVRCAKPHADIFAVFLEKLRQHTGSDEDDSVLASSCVFIDNKTKNVDAASLAGFHVVHYEAVKSHEKDLEIKLNEVGVMIDEEDDE